MTTNEPQPNKRNSPLVLWLVFLGALIVRACIPFVQSDSMALYNAVGWAVVSGENWGKQAVVGVWEYSPLPTLLVLLLAPLKAFRISGLHAGRMLPAVAQALTVVALFAVSGEFFRRWWNRAITTIIGMVVLGMGIGYHWIPGRGLLVADPFWALAPVAVLTVGFAARLGRFDSVRPLLVLSLSVSLLTFAGPAGMILAIAAIFALLLFGRKELKAQGGTPTLSIMPLGYALLLILLFNLVIMSDAFFVFRRVLPFFKQVGTELPALTGKKLILAIAWSVVALAALIPVKGIPFFARFSWVLAIACLPIFLFRKASHLFIGGESILMGTVLLALLFAIVRLLQSRDVSLMKGAFAIFLSCAFLASVAVLRRHSHAFEPFVDGDRPSPTQITDYLDDPEWDRWEGSRVMVFGPKASALYCIHNDTGKDRFIGNVDFNIHVLLEHVAAEQLHILIPPDNGVYYPKGSFFSQIHGRQLQEDWLFYEDEWNGWQLWRCIRARPQPGSFAN